MRPNAAGGILRRRMTISAMRRWRSVMRSSMSAADGSRSSMRAVRTAFCCVFTQRIPHCGTSVSHLRGRRRRRFPSCPRCTRNMRRRLPPAIGMGRLARRRSVPWRQAHRRGWSRPRFPRRCVRSCAGAQNSGSGSRRGRRLCGSRRRSLCAMIGGIWRRGWTIPPAMPTSALSSIRVRGTAHGNWRRRQGRGCRISRGETISPPPAMPRLPSRRATGRRFRMRMSPFSIRRRCAAIWRWWM